LYEAAAAVGFARGEDDRGERRRSFQVGVERVVVGVGRVLEIVRVGKNKKAISCQRSALSHRLTRGRKWSYPAGKKYKRQRTTRGKLRIVYAELITDN